MQWHALLEGSVSGFEQAVLPDDSGVELSGVQVDDSERGRGEAFTETRQRGPDGLHVCGGVTVWMCASLCPLVSLSVKADGHPP